MALTFDETAHTFVVQYPRPAQEELVFGNQKFFASINPIPNIPAVEQSMAAGNSLFGNALIPAAVKFRAECVVLISKGLSPRFTEAQLRASHEFGFVQGIRNSDVHVDYWGQVKANGRSILHVTMPSTFEVDTDTPMQPWTRVAVTRFNVQPVTPPPPGLHALKVTAEFDDHPLHVFNHTISHPTRQGVFQFIRSLSCRRDFQTIFCAREAATGDFQAISSTEWSIIFDHLVSYSDNGATRTVTNRTSRHTFPTGGGPSRINVTDRQVLDMAKAGSPLFTPAVLATRFGPSGPRTVTREETNPDFDPSFWR